MYLEYFMSVFVIDLTLQHINMLHISIFVFYCSDLVIAQSQTPKNIEILADEISLLKDEVDYYGKKKAKVSLKVLDRLQNHKNGKYVVVTG